MRAYFDGRGSSSIYGNQKVRLGLYSDVEGRPSQLILQTNEISIPFYQPAYWIDFETPQVVLQPGRYWIAIQSGPNGGIGRYFLSGSAQNWYGIAAPYNDLLSTYYGIGNSGTGTISAFVSYQPGNFETLTFGNTFGTTPTLLAGNAVTGSRFQFFAEGAVLTAVRAWVDSFGGTNGSQGLRMLVYKDDNGKPSELVAQSDEVIIDSGRQGWLTGPISPTPLPSGTYWLMVQSGEGGFVHLYQSGPPNGLTAPDSFADGPANPFQGDAATTVPATGTYVISADITVRK
jgi:hypothetical protein